MLDVECSEVPPPCRPPSSTHQDLDPRGPVVRGRFPVGRPSGSPTLRGGANAGVLLYNADLTVERYNLPDTLKGQHIFYLRHPYCLHSDMGRVLASIAADTVGWHDTVCGCSDAKLVAEKYGVKTYQAARNDFHRNGP